MLVMPYVLDYGCTFSVPLAGVLLVRCDGRPIPVQLRACPLGAVDSNLSTQGVAVGSTIVYGALTSPYASLVCPERRLVPKYS